MKNNISRWDQQKVCSVSKWLETLKHGIKILRIKQCLKFMKFISWGIKLLLQTSQKLIKTIIKLYQQFGILNFDKHSEQQIIKHIFILITSFINIQQLKMFSLNSNSLQFKTIRGHQSWQQILQSVILWSNKQLTSANQIKSINTAFCHYDNSGMVNIFYYKQPNDAGIQSKGVLCYQFFRNGDSWMNNNENYIIPKMNQIQSNNNCQVLCTNLLQINEGHNESLSIIWYIKY